MSTTENLQTSWIELAQSSPRAAVLAAWDAEGDRFDDYAWGITAELAGRAGRDPAAFERARAERASLLEELAAAGTLGRAAVAQAILAIARERERTH